MNENPNVLSPAPFDADALESDSATICCLDAASRITFYRDTAGVITQCSHCRRAKRSERGAVRWDWVAAFVARVVPNVSHGLCPLCARFYYHE